MSKSIEVLDCTLRDGAYINKSEFGTNTIRGILKRLADAKIDIIECGWLKNDPHAEGNSYYHTPSDLKRYLDYKDPQVTYVVMIDFDRYDTKYLTPYDGTSFDAVRVVFPRGKVKEGIEACKRIREKGYKVYCQASNTLGYTDKELLELADEINAFEPEGISVVDTFGAMYPEDLLRILSIVSHNLRPSIRIGFHSHNNQQLSFALSMLFTHYMTGQGREIIIDSSLCGMGRGAGNATTELVTSFLNRKYFGNYDLDLIMNTIDMYMVPCLEKYKWGYSIPNYIAGMYCSHVNNISYLLNRHSASAQEIRSVISSMSPQQRVKYDYDLREGKYIEDQNKETDDTKSMEALRSILRGRRVLLAAPGKSLLTQKDKVDAYIAKESPVVIGVNAFLPQYEYDYIFIMSRVRYEYAREAYHRQFEKVPKILLSSVKTKGGQDEYIVRYERAIQRGWPHFDNAVICLLRLLDKLGVSDVAIAGFDRFSDVHNESYADPAIPSLSGDEDWDALNAELSEIVSDFEKRVRGRMNLMSITPGSIFKKEP